jgi:hypothetical protein
MTFILKPCYGRNRSANNGGAAHPRDAAQSRQYKTTQLPITAYDQRVPVRLFSENRLDMSEVVTRRIRMAKGQVRGNKEAKKPKKPKQVVVPVGSFITPQKAEKPTKNQH